LIQWFRIEARTTASPVSETITFVGSTGIWQSMQLFAILCPSVFDFGQLCHWWHPRHFSEYAAAGRSAA